MGHPFYRYSETKSETTTGIKNIIYTSRSSLWVWWEVGEPSQCGQVNRCGTQVRPWERHYDLHQPVLSVGTNPVSSTPRYLYRWTPVNLATYDEVHSTSRKNTPYIRVKWPDQESRHHVRRIRVLPTLRSDTRESERLKDPRICYGPGWVDRRICRID